MSRRELLVIAGAAATPLLLAWLVLIIINTPAEGIMNEDRATKIVTDYLVSNDRYFEGMREPDATFGLIKYNGTSAEGDQRFHWLNADPRDKKTMGYNSLAVFSMSEGNYFSNETEDRFVWVVFNGEWCYATYFVDATTGELIGIDGYRGFCTYCWHMYQPEIYDDYIAALGAG